MTNIIVKLQILIKIVSTLDIRINTNYSIIVCNYSVGILELILTKIVLNKEY